MSIRSFRVSWLLVGTFAALLLTHGVAAQVLYGSLTGNISDVSGAAVPAAKVEAVNEGTGFSRQAIADARGVFLMQDLPAGAYKVTISAPSFANTVESGVPVVENTVRRLDVRLQVATLGQSVTVAGDAPPLQTDRADVNVQISSGEITNLPISSSTRSFESIFKTIPGFVPNGSGSVSASNPTQALQYYVNGSTVTGNPVKLDGASDIYPWQPMMAAYIPPAEAIATVSVVSNSMDAEQGFASGAAINAIIKSGTNQFHGAAWEYNTNSDLQARNYFYAGTKIPKNILNQFGLDLGGPIKKDKLFFFADWERTVQRTLYSSLQTVATDPLRQGNFSGIGTVIYDPATGTSTGAGRTPFPNNTIPAGEISPAAAKMIALLPEPNTPATVANDYFAAADWQFNRDNVDMKINYNPTEKSTIFGRYSIAPSHIFDPQVFGKAGGPGVDGGNPGDGPGRTQSVSIGGTYSFTPTLLIDGNAGFSRLNLAIQYPDAGQNYGLNVLGIPGTNGPSPSQGGIPNFSISGFSSLGDATASVPFQFRDNLWVESVNLSWIKGSHSIRVGAELFHYSIINSAANSTVGVRGGFVFSGGLTSLNGGAAPNLYNAWADFLLGMATGVDKDYQYINPAAAIESSYGFYARDQWQVSRKLTINYGLRYEIYPYSHAEHGIDGIHYDPSTNIVHLSGTNVDTGPGYIAPRLGIAYRLNSKTVVRAGYGINTNAETFRNNVQTYPQVISQQYSGANSYAAAGTLATGIPPLVGPDLSSGQVVLPPNYGSWSYPTPYHRGYAESYNFTIQRDFGRGYNLEAGYVGTSDIRPSDGVNINAAPPGAGKSGQPLYILYGNASVISSMEPIDGSRYNSLQLRATHRAGNATYGAAYTFSKVLDAADNEEGSSLTWNWVPMLYRNYALAGYDRTHNFQLYGTYMLPFGKGQSMLKEGIAAAIAGGWQINAIMSRTSGTPFTVSASATSLNSPGNTQTANQVVANVAILGGHGPGSPYFDPNAFAAVTAPTFGNSGRDILRGPGLFNLDASVFRNFNLGERFRLQFRAEAFGLTNTPQFANPGTTFGSATYDLITSSSGQRQIRFALKFMF
jgi:hypothetical protein